MSVHTVIAGMLGMGLNFVLVLLVLRLCHRFRFLTRSSELHHTHQTPMPRLGGVALATTFLGLELLVAFCFPEYRSWTSGRCGVMVCSLAMFQLGFWDDLQPLGAGNKLVAQILIAASACLFGLDIEFFKIPFTTKIIHLGLWGVPITILWLVALTNLINLIDGADGLASGICLMLMVLLAFVGSQSGGLELLTAGMAGALLSFLWFNFPPARIYLGDGGAYFLGFLIGSLSLLNSQKGMVAAALVAPLFVLALPIIDTLLALLRRSMHGLPLFRPDRQHLHHRLLAMGLSRRRMVLSVYAVTLVFLGMGVVAFLSGGAMVPLLFGLSMVLLLLLAGCLEFSRRWFNFRRVIGHSLMLRQRIRYATCLLRWLEMEGERQPTLEYFWSDLVFAAGKLGFSSVKLTLADGSRVWRVPGQAGRSPQRARYRLKDGRFGVLELEAQLCSSAKPGGEGGCCESRGSAAAPCGGITDEELFSILGELLAEAWSRTAAKWARGNETSLRFDAPTPLPQHVL